MRVVRAVLLVRLDNGEELEVFATDPLVNGQELDVSIDRGFERLELDGGGVEFLPTGECSVRFRVKRSV